MKFTTKQLTQSAMFTALIIISSQCSIMLPSGIPVTMQAFAMAFIGYLLGAPQAFLAYLIWLLLGICGLPVFSNYGSGLGYLFGYTGGYIIGYSVMVWLCGYGKGKPAPLAIGAGLIGMMVMHLTGTAGYARAAGIPFAPAFATASLPYLLKDAISVIMGWHLGKVVSRRLHLAGVL